MSTHILTCHCCGLPLQIVCPTHGTATVAQSWPDPAHGLSPRRLRPSSRRAQLLALLPRRGDATPPRLPDLARTLGVTDHYVRAEINALMQRKLVERIGRGQYVRTGVLA